MSLRDQQPPEAHYWNKSSEQVWFWMDAVRMQTERISKPYVDAELWSPRIADGLFLIVALFRLQRACELARTRVLAGAPDRISEADKALGRFRDAIPDLEHFRHGTEHFDAWIKDEGLTQPPDHWSP